MIRARTISTLLLVTLGCLLGCTQVQLEIGQEVDFAKCSELEVRRTTRTEVLAALGPPAGVGRCADGVALLYEYVHMRESQLGIGLSMVELLIPSSIFGFIKVSKGTNAVERDAVVFTFDRNGLLTGIGRGEWFEDYGNGAGVQFIVAIESVVESESLRLPPRSLTWGDEMLAPPPFALNVGNLPDVELRGSPEGANRVLDDQ